MIQIVLSGAANGILYGIMGLGLVMLYKGSRVLNFAHGEFGLFSAYVSWTLVVRAGMPPLVGLLGAVVTGAALGLATERFLIRPLGPDQLLPKAIGTLGLFLLLSISMIWLWQADAVVMPGLFPAGAVDVLGARVSWNSVGVFVTALGVLGALAAFFHYHPLGLLMRASADNPDGAALIGIRPGTVSALLWAITGILAALAGVLILPSTYLAAGAMLPVLLKGLAAAVAGGFVSLPGAVIAGLVIGIAEGLLGYWISPAWMTPFVFLVMFAILVVAPRGIFAERRVARV